MAIKSVIHNEALLFLEHNIHFSSRTLYVGNDNLDNGEESEVNATFASKAIKGLHFLDCAGDDPITIILNGYGGDYYYGMSVADFIQQCKCKVNINVFGPVMSASGIIFESATGSRGISMNSKFMMHYGTFSISDHSLNAKSWAKENDRTNEELETIYFNRIRRKHPKFSINKLQEMLRFDTILNCRESIDFGLADKIV